MAPQETLPYPPPHMSQPEIRLAAPFLHACDESLMCCAAELATQLQAHLGLLVLQVLPEICMDFSAGWH